MPQNDPLPPVTSFWLGRRRYISILEVQRRLFEWRKTDQISDAALFLEHDPVITLGRGAKAKHLLEARETLVARGIDVEATDRGGEITVHMPGQLVCYPIVRLPPGQQDVRRYVRGLTAVMSNVLAGYGVQAGEVEGLIGLWVDRELPANFRGADKAGSLAKIGALGVRLSRWVTMHGFALNLCPEMDLYRAVVPCGIEEFGVCSLLQLTGKRLEPSECFASAAPFLAEQLGRKSLDSVDLSSVPDLDLAEAIYGSVRLASDAGGAELSSGAG